MSNLASFKEAIQQKFQEDTCLIGLLCDSNIDIRTGQKNITIAEAGANLPDQVPFLGIKVPRTEPIAMHDNTGCYRSLVYLIATSKTSLKTTVIADRVQCLVSLKPAGESQKWFFDFTNECVVNKYTKFVNRFPAGPHRFDEETDVFSDVIELEVLWCACSCSGELCGTELPEEPELEIEDYDFDCDC